MVLSGTYDYATVCGVWYARYTILDGLSDIVAYGIAKAFAKRKED